jgi:peroxiredoxin Q/BCP
MNRSLALAAFASLALVAGSAHATLSKGAKAPEFVTHGAEAGKPITFDLQKALKKGPVVLYFFPSAYTKGCNLEAHLFSEAVADFKAQKATVIGVTAWKINELSDFSKETEHCGGKFAVAADPGAKIANQYDAPLKMAGMKTPMELSARTSYVIAQNGNVVFAYDNLDASDHVNQTLTAVKALNGKK